MNGLTVVKVGGSTVGEADSTLRDLASLHRQGERVVVVHGGGKEITRRLDEAGLGAEFVDGLRVTDERALPVVVEALDYVNADLVRRLREAEVSVRAFASADPALVARRIPQLGRVGDVIDVVVDRLSVAIGEGVVAVIAPLAREVSTGGLLNVNADTAAGEIAIALHAGRLVFSTDVDGVYSREGELLPLLHIDDAAVLLADGTADGGMAPKLRACMKAAGAGIESVILDGRAPGALLSLLEKGEARGTRIGSRASA